MIRNKKAFSLLEVLLAMAIMLIASVMIMQGFMSTYSYSGNTKVYAQNAAANSSQMYNTIAAHRGKNGNIASGSALDVALTGLVGNPKFSVNTWSAQTLTVPTFSSAYTESGAATSSKFAISYCLPKDLECPNCHHKDTLARDKNDIPSHRWFCTDCKVYVGP
jgi:prepilin-type N-terminal cleavage/methylation domain-containing protein